MTKPTYTLSAATASLLAACAATVPPSAKAAHVERIQCAGSTAAQDDLRLLQTTTVLKAEPIYSRVITSKSNAEDRVSGAKLVIRPPEGVSAERMTRTLQCHSARALLGQIDGSQLPDDPYFLPDSWLDIDVTPEAGNFAVTLRADTVSKNLHVLAQASAFADSHRASSNP
jgi:hypothetical protein